MNNINKYYNLERSREFISQNKHRDIVGGLWDEIGRLQFDFLVQQGLKPEMKLIDIGCGCLRGGVHFVDYLDAQNYYGTDISEDLLNVGYNEEISKLKLKEKLNRNHLLQDSEFNFSSFDVTFDFAIALSLFTHLPLNHVRLCLYRLAHKVNNGGVFCATFFLLDHNPEEWSEPVLHSPSGITTFPASDPYHYTETDLQYCVDGLPWELEIVGECKHPRDQKMVIFRKY